MRIWIKLSTWYRKKTKYSIGYRNQFWAPQYFLFFLNIRKHCIPQVVLLVVNSMEGKFLSERNSSGSNWFNPQFYLSQQLPPCDNKSLREPHTPGTSRGPPHRSSSTWGPRTRGWSGSCWGISWSRCTRGRAARGTRRTSRRGTCSHRAPGKGLLLEWATKIMLGHFFNQNHAWTFWTFLDTIMLGHFGQPKSC